MRPIAVALIVSLLWSPCLAAGQARASSASLDGIRTEALGISVDRIRRKLAQTPPREISTVNGLRIEYYIDVYGKPYTLDVLKGFDLQTGAVQYGPPTHTEFLNLVTPQEFRAPAADMLTPAMLLLQWLAKKAQKKAAQDAR
ncbi:MAG: hypothetical protein HYX76_01815 [Acidobacteria bacterium]|nr:hypothetical protein [Acidobacteriota bacterium]